MAESGGSERDAALMVLRVDRRWRTAVWALRVGFVGLALVIVGVIVNRSSSTTGFGILVAGLLVYVASSAVTLSRVLAALRSLPEPRPTFMTIRLDLVRDVFRRRPR